VHRNWRAQDLPREQEKTGSTFEEDTPYAAGPLLEDRSNRPQEMRQEDPAAERQQKEVTEDEAHGQGAAHRTPRQEDAGMQPHHLID
jgi:hypothetical protein